LIGGDRDVRHGEQGDRREDGHPDVV